MNMPTTTVTSRPPPAGTLDVMIDIETLSTRGNAAVISIGAVWFNPITLDVGLPIHLRVDMDSAIKSGGHVDGNTVAWWLQQSQAARDGVTQGTALPLWAALEKLSDYLHSVAPEPEVRVWGNGADFDMTILASAYGRVCLPLPWRYYNVRCFRTLAKLHPAIKPPADVGTAHNAAADALHQALHALAILQHMDRTNALAQQGAATTTQQPAATVGS